MNWNKIRNNKFIVALPDIIIISLLIWFFIEADFNDNDNNFTTLFVIFTVLYTAWILCSFITYYIDQGVLTFPFNLIKTKIVNSRHGRYFISTFKEIKSNGSVNIYTRVYTNKYFIYLSPIIKGDCINKIHIYDETSIEDVKKHILNHIESYTETINKLSENKVEILNEMSSWDGSLDQYSERNKNIDEVL